MNILSFVLREKPQPQQQPKQNLNEDRSSMAEFVRLLEQQPEKLKRN